MADQECAWPLDPADPALPETVREIVDKARTSWLRNAEVFEILNHATEGTLPLSSTAPDVPDGGCLFLIDRRGCRMFRKDGHHWRKKTDGKTVRETHEKLRVGSAERLNCYYAHAEGDSLLQRRCYWLLDPKLDYAVLVHYLNATSTRAQRGPRASAAAAAADASLEAGGAWRPQRANRGHNSRYAADLFEEASSLGLETDPPSSDADFDPGQDSLRESDQSFHGSAHAHAHAPPGGYAGGRPRPLDEQPPLTVLNRFPSDVSLGLELLVNGNSSFSSVGDLAARRGSLASLREQWLRGAGGSFAAAAAAPSYEEAISQQYAAELQGLGQGLGQGPDPARAEAALGGRGLPASFHAHAEEAKPSPAAPRGGHHGAASPGVLYVSQSLVQHQRAGSFSGRGQLFGQLSLGGTSLDEGRLPPGASVLSSLDFADEEDAGVASRGASFSCLPSLRMSFDASPGPHAPAPRLPSLTMTHTPRDSRAGAGPARRQSSGVGRMLEALQAQAPHGHLLDLHVDAWPGVDELEGEGLGGEGGSYRAVGGEGGSYRAVGGEGGSYRAAGGEAPSYGAEPSAERFRDGRAAAVAHYSLDESTGASQPGSLHPYDERRAAREAWPVADAAFRRDEAARSDDSGAAGRASSSGDAAGVAHQLRPSPAAPAALGEEGDRAAGEGGQSPAAGPVVFAAEGPEAPRVMADRASRLARPSPPLSRVSPVAGEAPGAARRQLPTACPPVRQVDRAAAAAAATHDQRAAKLGPVRAQRSSELPDEALAPEFEAPAPAPEYGARAPPPRGPSALDEDAIDLIDAENPLFRFKSFLGGPRAMLSAPNSFQRDAAEGAEGDATRRGEGPDADDPAPVARPGDEEEELVARKLLKNMSIDENDAAIVHNVRASMARDNFPSITEESSGGAAGASARSGSRALSEEGSEGALSPEPRLAADARAKRPALRFHIIDFAPESAAVSGGDKMFVTGWVEKAGGDWEGAVHVRFGDVEVPATLVNPAVIKCTIPAVDAPRLAELCVTLGDGVPVSNVMSFEFLHIAAWRADEGLAGGF